MNFVLVTFWLPLVLNFTIYLQVSKVSFTPVAQFVLVFFWTENLCFKGSLSSTTFNFRESKETTFKFVLGCVTL